MTDEKGSLLELKKHVNTIHCKNTLSLVQRKLFNALLFNAYHDLPKKISFEIPVKKLCKYIGYNSNDYKVLKNSLLGLMSITIEWNVLDDHSKKEDTKWAASTILSAARLESGVCNYEYSATLKELLFKPEIFGRINLEVQSKFKSNYGLALYENCIRYTNIPYTRWISIDVFRKLMGVKDGCYKNIKDFKKRVVNIAVQEVNKHSPQKIFPEFKKTNEELSIRFKLINEKLEINVSDESSLQECLKKTFQCTSKFIKEIFLNYEPSYIKEKVEMILNSKSFKNNKISSLPAYLKVALKENYQLPKTENEVLDNQSIRGEVTVLSESNLGSKKNYFDYLKKNLKEFLELYSSDEIAALYQQFQEYLRKNNSIILEYSISKNDGIFDPYKTELLEIIVSALVKNNPELSTTFMSFDRYCASQNEIIEKGTFTG